MDGRRNGHGRGRLIIGTVAVGRSILGGALALRYSRGHESAAHISATQPGCAGIGSDTASTTNAWSRSVRRLDRALRMEVDDVRVIAAQQQHSWALPSVVICRREPDDRQGTVPTCLSSRSTIS
jgi:hypothetical protein